MAATPVLMTENSGASATTHATASFAIVTGDCYLIVVEGNATGITNPTITGLSQTWTQLGNVPWDNQGAGNTRRLCVLGCIASSTTSGAATIDWGGTATVALWSVIRIQGVQAGTITQATGTVATNNSESNATSGSISGYTIADPLSAVIVAASHRATEAATQRTGWFELSDRNLATNHCLEVAWHSNDATPTASWSSLVKWAMLAVEVKPNPASGLTGVDRGSGATNTGSQNTLVITPTSNFRPRSLAVLVVAYDNSGTNGADAYSAITDSVGNTWTPRINSLIDPGAANEGQALRIFTSDMAVATLTVSNTITVSFGGVTTVARTHALHEISPDASGTPTYVTGAQETATTGTPTITTSSITAGDMVIGAIGREGNEAPTGDADTSSGDWTAVLGGRVGTTTAGSQLVTQRKVATGTATQTYNPTFGGTSRDGCEAWAQFREVAATSFPACLFLGARRRRA